MAGSDWDGRRELTWLLAEEAQAASDRIAAELRALETGERPAGPQSLVPLRASVRALQSALTKMLDVHGALRSVARPERAQLDVVAVAGEVAEEAAAEGIPVRVEPRTATATFFADGAELRRILRLLVERAAATGENERARWIVLGVAVAGSEVVFEVPWTEAGTAADEAEREWLQRAVRRQAGVLTTVGGVARVVLSSVVRGGDEPDAMEHEMEALRRRSELYVLELDAARRQGEAYARDVADLFAEVEARDVALAGMAVRWERAARTAGAVARDLRKLLAPIARQAETLAPRGGAPAEAAAAILVHLRGAAGVLKRLKEIFHDPSPGGSSGTSRPAASSASTGPGASPGASASVGPGEGQRNGGTGHGHG